MNADYTITCIFYMLIASLPFSVISYGSLSILQSQQVVTWNTWWICKVSADAKDKGLGELMFREINKQNYDVPVDNKKKKLV